MINQIYVKGKIDAAHLLRVVLEGEEADPAEYRLEGRRGYMAPVEHPVELAAIYEVTLERRQEDLRRVAEDDYAKGNRKCLHIERPLDLRPAPVADLQDAVADYDRVYEQVSHRAPEAQHRHVVQGFQEAQRYQEYADQLYTIIYLYI